MVIFFFPLQAKKPRVGMKLPLLAKHMALSPRDFKFTVPGSLGSLGPPVGSLKPKRRGDGIQNTVMVLGFKRPQFESGLSHWSTVSVTLDKSL